MIIINIIVTLIAFATLGAIFILVYETLKSK